MDDAIAHELSLELILPQENCEVPLDGVVQVLSKLPLQVVEAKDTVEARTLIRSFDLSALSPAGPSSILRRPLCPVCSVIQPR